MPPPCESYDAIALREGTVYILQFVCKIRKLRKDKGSPRQGLRKLASRLETRPDNWLVTRLTRLKGFSPKQDLNTFEFLIFQQ